MAPLRPYYPTNHPTKLNTDFAPSVSLTIMPRQLRLSCQCNSVHQKDPFPPIRQWKYPGTTSHGVLEQSVLEGPAPNQLPKGSQGDSPRVFMLRKCHLLEWCQGPGIPPAGLEHGRTIPFATLNLHVHVFTIP